MKKITVIVNDKPFEVELGEVGAAETTVLVNGKEYRVRLEEEAAPVAVAAPVKTVAPSVVPPAAPRPAAPVAGGNVLTAPMPGVIKDIQVKPGDKVAHGGQLCALEAMKMKNAIRAGREVVIASVEVTEGQRVNFGDVLFRFQ